MDTAQTVIYKRGVYIIVSMYSSIGKLQTTKSPTVFEDASDVKKKNQEGEERKREREREKDCNIKHYTIPGCLKFPPPNGM